MEESYNYWTIRVQVEQQRFLGFAKEAGLLYNNGKLCATLQVNHAILRDVLLEINSAFQKYEQKAGKYSKIVGKSKIVWDDKGEPPLNLTELLCVSSADATKECGSLREKISFPLPQLFLKVGDQAAKAACKLRTIIREPRRLSWVSFDREEFETLVSKLKDLNSFLTGLLDESHKRRLQEAIESNYLELLQLRNDVASLQSLIHALAHHSAGRDKTANRVYPALTGDLVLGAASIERETDLTNNNYLIQLAKLKIRNIEIDQTSRVSTPSILCSLTSMSLDLSSLNFPTEVFNDYGRRSIASWNNRSVWLEWIEQSSSCMSDRTTISISEERVILLTRLLNEGIPSGFRAPTCLGYVKSPRENDKAGLGIVFERPSGVDTDLRLKTLRQLLLIQQKPPLTTRVSLGSDLAYCLFCFHAVEWLHKGLRSENIIFFITDQDEQDLKTPYITGYDFSRPNKVPEMTENPLHDPQCDIYRHPYAQFGEAKRFYRKAFDIYSLGIILIEVALWKPIEVILGVEDLTSMTSKALSGVKTQLLGLDGGGDGTTSTRYTPANSELLVKIASECGDSYRDVVEICLEANEVEMPAYRGESQASITSRLHMMFKEQVTGKLRLMEQILSSSK